MLSEDDIQAIRFIAKDEAGEVLKSLLARFESLETQARQHSSDIAELRQWVTSVVQVYQDLLDALAERVERIEKSPDDPPQKLP